MKYFLRLCVLQLAFVCGVSTALAAAGHRPLVVVAPFKMTSLNLSKSGFIFARMGCLEMLTTTDSEGRIVGFLAKSWAIEPDRLTWIFHLHQNVVFHDGTPLTAQAVAKSLEISINDKGVLTKAGITEITTIDTLTLKIRTAAPFSSLPAYLAHYSSGIVSEASYDAHNKLQKLYGTGQFIYTGRQGNTMLHFRANPHYWGPKPLIEKADYQAVPNPDTRGFMMKAGQADMAFTLSAQDAEQLRKTADADVVTMVIPRTTELVFNTALPLFSDIRVRLAISLAIDRQGIATGLLHDPKFAATQLLPGGVSAWHVPTIKPLVYNLTEAKNILAKAGWKPGQNGILTKDGRQFAFELTTYASRPMLPLIATAIQQQLREVGIKMDITVGESSLIPDKHMDGSLQAGLVARNFGQIPDPFGTIYDDFGPNPGGWGAVGWKSQKLYGMLNAYLSAFDSTKANMISSNISTLLQNDLPVLPITWYDHIVAVSHQITGVKIDPFEIKSYIRGVRWTK